MKNKKAQIWAIDLSIAMVLFIGVIFLFYNYSISFAPENPIINKLIAEGGYVSGTLVSTGFPGDWDLTTINETYSFGLLDEQGFLDLRKLGNFSTWVGNSTTGINDVNYSLSKRKINTKYEYYINFSDSYLADVGLNFNGQNPKQLVKIQRLVLYSYPVAGLNDYHIKPVKLNVYIWTNEAA